MRLGLVVRRDRPAASAFAAELAAEATRRGLQVAAALEGEPLDGGAIDLVVAVGGDGTMLSAVRRALELDRPVLGFNLGRLGFLAQAERADLGAVVEDLAGGRYRIEERMTIAATMPDGRVSTGVNDVVVEKIESQRLVVLEVEIDGERFLTYRADGVVVATSTGSTAYALSAGGPLVDPRLDALLVTAVAPHSLFDRTLVLPPGAEIRCRMATARPVRVSLDGVELGTLRRGEEVAMGRGRGVARFVTFGVEGFPTRAARKLLSPSQWGTEPSPEEA